MIPKKVIDGEKDWFGEKKQGTKTITEEQATRFEAEPAILQIRFDEGTRDLIHPGNEDKNGGFSLLPQRRTISQREQVKEKRVSLQPDELRRAVF